MSSDLYFYDIINEKYRFTVSVSKKITTLVDIVSHLKTVSLNSDNFVLEESKQMTVGNFMINEEQILQLANGTISCLKFIINDDKFDITHTNLKDLNLHMNDLFQDKLFSKYYTATAQIEMK